MATTQPSQFLKQTRIGDYSATELRKPARIIDMFDLRAGDGYSKKWAESVPPARIMQACGTTPPVRRRRMQSDPAHAPLGLRNGGPVGDHSCTPTEV
ncbi:unnamed protein product, partial [Iphiclides podalirius]